VETKDVRVINDLFCSIYFGYWEFRGASAHEVQLTFKGCRSRNRQQHRKISRLGDGPDTKENIKSVGTTLVT